MVCTQTKSFGKKAAQGEKFAMQEKSGHKQMGKGGRGPKTKPKPGWQFKALERGDDISARKELSLVRDQGVRGSRGRVPKGWGSK